jgi:hypothetical protein
VAFQDEWDRPESKIAFSKPSSELLQVRKQQKSYALIHDFPNAKAMKQKALALERKESAEGARQFQSTLRAAYAQLIERQQREITCLMDNAEFQITNLERNKEKEILSIQNIRRSLESRLQTAGVRQRKEVRVPRLAKTRDLQPRRTMMADDAVGLITVRTREQMTVYRRNPDRGRLAIHPGDAGSILHPLSHKRPVSAL